MKKKGTSARTPTQPLETAIASSAEDPKNFKKLLMDQVCAGGGTQAIDTKQLFQNLVKDTLEAFSRARDGRAPGLCQTRCRRPRQRQLPQWRATPKTVRGDFGQGEIETPRDRNSSFEPKVVAKRQTSVGNFSEAVVSLYARGMSTREIEQHIQDIYGVEISPQFVSCVTEELQQQIVEWQSRPLERVYPLVFVDGLRVAVRIEKGVVKKCVYTVLGVSLLCGDGLTGLGSAVESVFPQADVQLCVVHHIRNVTKFVSLKDRKPLCDDMRPIYTAATVEAAELARAPRTILGGSLSSGQLIDGV